MENAAQFDSEVLALNDGSDSEVARILRLTRVLCRDNYSIPFYVLSKSRSMGMVHSSKIALAYTRMFNPQYWFIAESDFIFKIDCYKTVLDVFENTEEGKMCLGIVGYDAPNAYTEEHRNKIFPNCMRRQMGEDNVNRAAMHKSDWKPWDGLSVELASNTSTTCYLNWHRICDIGKEFPEIHALLDQAADPQDNPDYSMSGYYKELQMFDDGMLSHAINLVWNRWAIKHGIDRDKFGAWLNIKPSVAQSVTGGGIHCNSREMSTTQLSPSWRNDG